MQNVETFLDNLFTESAKEKEREQKDKIYKYVLLSKDLFETIRKVTCKVVSRRYDRSIDCDILRCVDIDTNEAFSCNQFRIELSEIK